MKFLILLSTLVLFASCSPPDPPGSTRDSVDIPYDHHVHIMSPELISYWKGLGIPFSRPEDHYSNIDTILKYNGAQRIKLVSMGYVYANPEYYEGDDHRARMIHENDYVLRAAGKYPERIQAYFAVDPLKDYAVEELERCYRADPNSGLKLHFNASQVYLTEALHLAKVKRVFEKAAAQGIPMLLHFDNWHPKFGQPDLELFADSILAQIPGIELQIAHLGTSGGFNVRTKRFIDAYLVLRDQDRIPPRHNIRFDLSAVALEKDSEGVPKLTEEQFEEVRQYIHKIGLEHIVFGTDYPLYRARQYLDILKEKVGLGEVHF